MQFASHKNHSGIYTLHKQRNCTRHNYQQVTVFLGVFFFFFYLAQRKKKTQTHTCCCWRCSKSTGLISPLASPLDPPSLPPPSDWLVRLLTPFWLEDAVRMVSVADSTIITWHLSERGQRETERQRNRQKKTEREKGGLNQTKTKWPWTIATA